MADDLTYATGNATGLPAGSVVRAELIDDAFHQVLKIGLGENGAVDGDLEGAADITLLTSAAHATGSGVPSADVQRPSHKGALFFLDTTVVGGSSDTLSLKVQAKDPASGNYIDLFDFGVIVTGSDGTGTYAAMVYPALVLADVGAGVVAALGGALPLTWRAVVTASDTTSWTYSLGCSLLAF